MDSGSNIFVINKELVECFDIPYEMRQKALNILAFDGEVNASGGKHFTHPILLDIGKNGHHTHISCEVASAGKYDLIIPFGWWHKEHPISNIDDSKEWIFGEQCCLGHVQDEGVGGMFEWDKTVAFDEEAQYVGRICRQEDPNQVLVDRVPQHYQQYRNLFHQQKFRLHHMRQPCILTQATSHLHPEHPEHPDAEYATWLHPVLCHHPS